MTIKKAVVGAALSAMMLGALVVPAAVPASAAPSSCGAAHGAFANVNGNFGDLGEVGGTPGYHNGAVGQEPGATGYNNSNSDCQS
jgi:hypothetical protein